MDRTPPTTCNSLDDEVLDFDNLKVTQIIGSGITSDVMKCQIGQNTFAMKLYKQTISQKQRALEVSILKNLNHLNILQYIKCDSMLDWFITELLLDKDLFDFVKGIKIKIISFLKVEKFQLELVVYIFNKLVDAIQLIHSRGIAHRDLKLENILLQPETFEPKISDFGFALYVDMPDLRQGKGTQGYMAPECIFKDHYDYKAADIFSLGVILYILYYGSPPFESTDPADGCKFWLRMQSRNYWENKKGDQEIKQLLSQMLDYDPTQRPTIEKVKQSFLNGPQLNQMDYIKEMQRRYSLI